jgi:addiction module RelB/DinJ family antitoxin
VAKTTLLRARVDTKRKKYAEAILGRYGLTPAQAINVFYAKVTEIKGLPFDLRPSKTDELLANPVFQKHLVRMKTGKVRYRDASDISA